MAMTEGQVERWLESMPLARPSAALDDRIAAAASEAGRRPGPIARIGWLAGLSGMAAGLLIGVLAWPLLPGENRPAERGVEVAGGAPDASNAARRADRGGDSAEAPIEATVSTTRVVDEGVVMLEDGPARKLRRVTTRQMLYYDEASNERLEVTVPEEEVYFVAPESF